MGLCAPISQDTDCPTRVLWTLRPTTSENTCERIAVVGSPRSLLPRWTCVRVLFLKSARQIAWPPSSPSLWKENSDSKVEFHYHFIISPPPTTATFILLTCLAWDWYTWELCSCRERVLWRRHRLTGFYYHRGWEWLSYIARSTACLQLLLHYHRSCCAKDLGKKVN